MISEYSIGDLYVAPIVVYALVALPLFLTCRSILGRTGVLGFVWHCALFELALYISILSLLVLYA